MASIRKIIALDIPADRAWDALRDFQAVDTRLAPGFVVKSVADGAARIVTFANGTVAREEFVGADDSLRRLAYAICTSERLKHYNGAAEIVADGERKCRFVWTIDVLPDGMGPYVSSQMNVAVGLMKKALEGASGS